jgi:hypothetical protein
LNQACRYILNDVSACTVCVSPTILSAKFKSNSLKKVEVIFSQAFELAADVDLSTCTLFGNDIQTTHPGIKCTANDTTAPTTITISFTQKNSDSNKWIKNGTVLAIAAGSIRG